MKVKIEIELSDLKLIINALRQVDPTSMFTGALQDGINEQVMESVNKPKDVVEKTETKNVIPLPIPNMPNAHKTFGG